MLAGQGGNAGAAGTDDGGEGEASGLGDVAETFIQLPNDDVVSIIDEGVASRNPGSWQVSHLSTYARGVSGQLASVKRTIRLPPLVRGKSATLIGRRTTSSPISGG